MTDLKNNLNSIINFFRIKYSKGKVVKILLNYTKITNKKIVKLDKFVTFVCFFFFLNAKI